MTDTAYASMRAAPGAYPLVGHIPQMLRDRLGFLTSCGEINADVVRLGLERDTYVLLSSSDIRHVLETNSSNYDKSPRLISPRGKDLSGSGLLTSSGQEHRERRRTLTPVFSRRSIEPLLSAMVSQIDEYLGGWRAGQVIDLATAMMDLAQCINGRILFNADYRGADRKLADAILVRRRYIRYVFGSLIPLPEYRPGILQLAYRRAQRVIDQEIAQRVAARRADPTRFVDILAHLAQIQMANDAHMSEQDLHDEALTAAITGYETIGEGVAWSLLLLAQNPGAAEMLLQEVAGDQRSPALANRLAQLTFTDMVLSESLRLYPPTWLFVRIAQAEDRLPSGGRLPSGARVYLCPWIVHRSARYWSDPLRFNPTRFTPGAQESRPRYAYFPFGGGPRVCIGQSLAKMQMVLTLATMVRRFAFELLPGQKIVPDPNITLHPHPGILVRVHPRR